MKGIKFRAKSKDTGEILIYDDIGGFLSEVTAKTFTDELKSLGGVTEINVRINSGGGNVFDGVAIYNSLKRHAARVVVDIDGLAASIASIVAMAGDEIRMADNAMLMIHDPWIMTMGSADELRDTAGTLDKIRDVLLDTYVDRASADRETISQMMTDETWMNSSEAIDHGFVDVVTDDLAIAAHCDKKRFRNAPAELDEIIVPEKVHLSASVKQIHAKTAQILRRNKL